MRTIAFLLLLSCAGVASAQDPAVVNAATIPVTPDNERVARPRDISPPGPEAKKPPHPQSAGPGPGLVRRRGHAAGLRFGPGDRDRQFAALVFKHLRRLHCGLPRHGGAFQILGGLLNRALPLLQVPAATRWLLRLAR